MEEQFNASSTNPVDLLVIGGGINGCSIARDAVGRGLSVTLCDMNDLASATSSYSSKLIHGGLRYLENYEFKLVHDALAEREVLMHSAPFLIHPLKFILPYEKHLRSPWLLRIGLFLYDHLSKRHAIPGSKKEFFKWGNPQNALARQFQFGYSYYDCQTDDARLTVLCARDAFEQGATILTHTYCSDLKHDGRLWSVTLQDQLDGRVSTVQARAVINAAGPWVDHVNNTIAKIDMHCITRLVQGSHIVVPKLYEGYHAYILQNEDGRIVFAIPYLDHFTLIGTTDVEYHGDPTQVHITQSEIDYLCHSMNSYFHKKITPSDIVWSYAGVRALYDDGANKPSNTTREYHLELHAQDTPPYLAVFGGKLTTCRVLAEDVVNHLNSFFPNMSRCETHDAFLPGGDLGMPWDQFLTTLATQYPWLPETLRHRYARAYGNNLHALIGDATSLAELGIHFGADLYEHEVLYWIENEWAHCSDDMLWRRSKLGLFLTEEQVNTLKNYLDEPTQ